MVKLKLIIVFAVLAIFVACSGTATNTANTAVSNANAVANANATVNSNSNATAVAATGTELYAKHCSECHKATGKGGKVTVDGKEIEPDDLTTAKMAAKPDAKFKEYIDDGFPDDGMPPFKDKLSETETKEVIKYLRANILKPGK